MFKGTMSRPRSGEITRLLAAAGEGDRQAARELLPLVYEDLRGLARSRLRKQRRGETITTTDLVHEAWLRLVSQGDPGWEGRRHFYGSAARAMRNILVEQTRKKSALKRDAARRRELDEDLGSVVDGPPLEDVISVGDALEKFEREHARAAEVVWLRFFAGLTMPEVAEVMSTSLATAERDWRFARAWLQNELGRKDL
jgi:RNA polymerase sigma factor (TIGR02999 family)